MRFPAAYGIGITLFGLTSLVWAQPPVTPAKTPAKPPQQAPKVEEDPELTAIRKTVTEFSEAFNSQDAKRVAALWTKDGEYSSGTGELIVGQPAIESDYKAFFESHPNLKIRVQIDSLRLLGSTTAIEDGRTFLEPTLPGAPPFARYTAIHVKEGSTWKMASVRELPVAIPAARRQIADLDWLVGKWVAEEHGSVSESTFEWAADKNFLKRTYTITHHDKTKTSGIQIIGYSPSSGQIQSWSFSSDGSIAIGVWTPEENGWAASVRGITIDGTETFAVNLLTRLDDNAQCWQSIGRRIGDVALPDTPEVILKRQE